MLLLDDNPTVLDATFTNQCVGGYLNQSCMPNCNFMDVNIHVIDETPSNIHVAFVKALYLIPIRRPITVHYNWELHKNHEMELCDCQTMQFSGLPDIRRSRTDPEKDGPPPCKHVIYGGLTLLMHTTAAHVMKNCN